MCTYAMSRGTWYTPPTGGYRFDVGAPSTSRDASDINRVSRRTAEKRRRDRLTSYINELATLVPTVARSARKLDKTSILRLTATHLLLHQTLLYENNSESEDFSNIDQSLIEQLLCEQLNGFLLVVTTRGLIAFVSSSVEQLLGHLQTDLMGQSLYNITNPEDHELLRVNLNPENQMTAEWKKHFNIRLKRAGTRSEPPTYETVNCRGCQKPRDKKGSPNSYSSARELATASSSNNDLLIFFIRLFRPEVYTNRLIEATKNEYITRHLLDGRIVNCDQRISLVAGYMSEEVSGLCAFNFMHRQDVRWVMIALRQMYDRGESKGSSCYRLLSKTGQFIYLRTYGYLEIDSSGIVESFVCINTLVDEEEGRYLIKEMKSKYSALIKSHEVTNMLQADEIDVASVEDPLQLEAAVAHLITNLPSPGSENCSTPSPPCLAFENQDCQNTTENCNYSLNSSVTLKINKQTSKRIPPNSHDILLYNKRRKTDLSVSSSTTSPPYQMINQKTESGVVLSTSPPYQMQTLTQNVNVEPSSTYKQNHLLSHKI